MANETLPERQAVNPAPLIAGAYREVVEGIDESSTIVALAELARQLYNTKHSLEGEKPLEWLTDFHLGSIERAIELLANKLDARLNEAETMLGVLVAVGPEAASENGGAA